MRRGRRAYQTAGALASNEVLVNSLKFLAPEDLHAMATYLKSLPARRYTDGPVSAQQVRAGAPVYMLPLLRKVNAYYDASFFSRPEEGDSSTIESPAKVRFNGDRTSRELVIGKLKAGEERLADAFTVLERGKVS